MRRAIVLRGLLEKHRFTRKTNDKGERAMVDEAVIYAMLKVDEYQHSVRSMEAILLMCSSLDGHLQIGSLPTRSQLKMHVDPEKFYEEFYVGRSRQSRYGQQLKERYPQRPQPTTPTDHAKALADIVAQVKMILRPPSAVVDIKALTKLQQRIDALEGAVDEHSGLGGGG
jgi:hypothetical protein